MSSVASTRVSGGVVALRICSSIATIVFAVLALIALLMPHQSHRLTLVAIFVASVVVCAVISRVAHSVDEREAEWLLLVLCLVPTVDALMGIVVLRDPGVTDFLFVAFFVYGLLTMRWQTLAVLMTGTASVWLAVVLALDVPTAVVGHDLVQLALRAAIAFAVFKIRSRLDGELRRTGVELDDQVAALARTRELHGRELSRFRTMFEDGPLGIMVMDTDGIIVDANRSLGVIVDLPREQVIGQDIKDLVHPDDRPEADQAHRNQESAAGGRLSLERRFRHTDGTVVHASVTARSISGPEGEPLVLAYVEDVTRRKAMERDLIRSRDGMRAVADISSAAQRGSDPRPVALAHLERLAGANHVSLIEPARDGVLAITATIQPELVGVEIDLDKTSATAHVWHTGEPLFLADAESSPMVNQSLLDIAAMTSLMWQPVGAPGELLAILSIGWPETVEGVGDVSRDAVRTIAAELTSALTSERLRRQLEEKSRVDVLTGLMNRRGWDHGVAELLHHSRRTGRPFVLAVADLDHFKQFNDEFGHLEGDILLAGFAANARTTMREVDLLARWGGEEFAIGLRDCDLSDAQPVLERIRQAVPAGRSCSIGFATFHPDETVEACMRRADEALYRAKANGRDRIEYGHYGAPAPATEGQVRERRRAR